MSNFTKEEFDKALIQYGAYIAGWYACYIKMGGGMPSQKESIDYMTKSFYAGSCGLSLDKELAIAVYKNIFPQEYQSEEEDQ